MFPPELTFALTVLVWLVIGGLALYGIVWVIALLISIPAIRKANKANEEMMAEVWERLGEGRRK